MINSFSATGQPPHTTQTSSNVVTIDCIVANTPIEVAAEALYSLLYEVQTLGNRALPNMNAVGKIKSILKRKFSKVVKYCGFTLKQVNKWFLQCEGCEYLPDIAVLNAAPSQLERIARYKDEEIIGYVDKARCQLDLEVGLGSYYKEKVKPKKPPKRPKEALDWKFKAGGGRILGIMLQDGRVAQLIMKLYQQFKDKITAEQMFGLMLEGGVELENLEPNTTVVEVTPVVPEDITCTVADKDVLVQDIEVVTSAVEEIPPSLVVCQTASPNQTVQEPLPFESTPQTEEVVQVEVEEPPKPVRRIPTPDAWKKGWNVGERCLPIYKTTEAVRKLYDWTKGEFPVIESVRGEVGTNQMITLVRADGERYETYGNWIVEAPTSNEEITCEYYLRQYRISFKLLLDSKAANDNDGIMAGRCDVHHFDRKLTDFGKEHPEYLEHIYTERKVVQAQTNLVLTSP